MPSSSTPPHATKQLDDTMIKTNPAAQPTAEFLPPSSLTVMAQAPLEPKSIAITGHSNCLLSRAPVTPREAIPKPKHVRTRLNRTRRRNKTHTSFHLRHPNAKIPPRSNLQRGSHATINLGSRTFRHTQQESEAQHLYFTSATLKNRLPGSRVLRAR